MTTKAVAVPETIPELRRAAVRALLTPSLPRHIRDSLAVAAGADEGVFEPLMDSAIARIDELVSAQIDLVLHHPAFQRLESGWRGIAHVIDSVDFHENTRVVVWACSKDELMADAVDATDWTRTALYQHVYTAEFGTFGGEPYGAILADMEFGSNPNDLRLLRSIAAVAAAAHAPFFTGALPSIFGLHSWKDISAARDLAGVFESPAYVAWNAFRESPDSRYAGLVLPRMLMRARYRASALDGYTEQIGTSGEGVLWGSAVYALAVRFARMFARDRSLSALVGDDYDAVRAFASESFDTLGPLHVKPSLEVTVTPRIERALREAGFMALQQRRGSPYLHLGSAHSLQKPKYFGASVKSREAAVSYLLGTQFPYLFLASRFAHYIKVLERDLVGSHRTADEVESDLSEWLGRYVINMDAIPASLRARFPLRAARVTVRPDPALPGGFHAEIMLRPHLRYLDSHVTLTVSSTIDRR